MSRKQENFSISWLFSFIPSDFPLIILPTFTVQPDIAENFQSCWNHLKRKWLLLLRTSCLGTRSLPPFFPLPLSFRFAPLSLDFFAPLNLFSIFSFFSPLFPLSELCFPPSLAPVAQGRNPNFTVVGIDSRRNPITMAIAWLPAASRDSDRRRLWIPTGSCRRFEMVCLAFACCPCSWSSQKQAANVDGCVLCLCRWRSPGSVKTMWRSCTWRARREYWNRWDAEQSLHLTSFASWQFALVVMLEWESLQGNICRGTLSWRSPAGNRRRIWDDGRVSVWPPGKTLFFHVQLFILPCVCLYFCSCVCVDLSLNLPLFLLSQPSASLPPPPPPSLSLSLSLSLFLSPSLPERTCTHARTH